MGDVTKAQTLHEIMSFTLSSVLFLALSPAFSFMLIRHAYPPRTLFGL
jgi:hypothetical protein